MRYQVDTIDARGAVSDPEYDGDHEETAILRFAAVCMTIAPRLRAVVRLRRDGRHMASKVFG